VIDTHVHLWDRRFDQDRDAARARMIAAGVTRRLEVGADLVTSRLALEAARADKSVLATAGVHPHSAADPADVDFRAVLKDLLAEERVVAVGECGLDYFRDLSPRDAQQEAFAFHIALARYYGYPLVVHERDAWNAVMANLETGGAERYGGVLHCFSHGKAHAEEAFAHNFVLGLGGTVTRGQAWARELLPWVPLDRIVLETDSPYLIPASLPRSGRNEPSYLPLIAQAIAEAKGISVETVAQATTETALRIFGTRAPWREATSADAHAPDGAALGADPEARGAASPAIARETHATQTRRAARRGARKY
jgi:TatD DNase family protein